MTVELNDKLLDVWLFYIRYIYQQIFANKGSHSCVICNYSFKSGMTLCAASLSLVQRSHHLSPRSLSEMKEQNWNSSTSTYPSNCCWSCVLLGGARRLRQIGHVACLNPVHPSKHGLWKRWAHLSSPISSPSSILHRHTEHSAVLLSEFVPALGLYRTVVSDNSVAWSAGNSSSKQWS